MEDTFGQQKPQAEEVTFALGIACFFFFAKKDKTRFTPISSHLLCSICMQHFFSREF